jgi:hypothetical protein
MIDLSLGMSHTLRMECFGTAFLLAVAGAAGCAASSRQPDDDSIDWTLSCRLSRRPKLDVQMKSTTSDEANGDVLHYDLKRKNYDDLIISNVLAPRILIVVSMPSDVSTWLAWSPEQLVLRRCAYWVSLAGRPATANAATVTIHVPRANAFTPDALRTMMQDINEKGAL